MGAAEFLVIFLMLVFSGPVALVVCGAVGALLEEARNDGGTLCAPSRRANITASVPQARRRRVQPVPPPYTFDTRPRRVPAPTIPQQVSVPDLAPIAVDGWPTRQTVEQPAQVTVNRTAARFGALEIKRD